MNSFWNIGQLSSGMTTTDQPFYHAPEAFQSPQSLTDQSSSIAYTPARDAHFQRPHDEQFFAGQPHPNPATIHYPLFTLNEPSFPRPEVSNYPEVSTIAPIGHEGIVSNTRLKPIAYKEENGTVKAIYDDNELKAYCLQNDLPYPPMPEKKTKKVSDGGFKATQDWKMSLLPVQTGGHDPSIPSPLRRGSVAFAEAQKPSLLSRLRLRRSQSDYSLSTNGKPQDYRREFDERSSVISASTTSRYEENSYSSSPRLARWPLLNHDSPPDCRNQLVEVQVNNTDDHLKQLSLNLPSRQPLSPPNVSLHFDPEFLEEHLCHPDIHDQNSLRLYFSPPLVQGSQSWYPTSFGALGHQLHNQQQMTGYIQPDGNSWMVNESPIVPRPKYERVRFRGRGRGSGSRRKTFFCKFLGEQNSLNSEGTQRSE